MTSFSMASKETNDQVSWNDEAFKNVSSNIEEQLPKKDDIIVSKSKPSSIASKFPSIPSKGNSSKIVEDLSYSLLITKELEQLVSKKHLASENLSLLTDFLVLHPSLHLKDTSLSNRYKGCAYSLLAQLLKFLQTHSAVDAMGSYRTEFVELLQDAHSFGFDKDWLNGVERRGLFPDIQVLDSKQQVTKEFEMLRFKIDNLSQYVEDLKHQLTSSETVLESIIQKEADLSAPIGY
ncbi:hypothetical protein KIW84_054469 [Lathyrus oleraceus]|uniref:Uncharacterized protein n=3 Tax=Pisum sativum TaxID=3888 RepID=A0A9D4WT57_PEA|nr:hypothetical protein KIW84_054469 [Pisum sativum]